MIASAISDTTNALCSRRDPPTARPPTRSARSTSAGVRSAGATPNSTLLAIDTPSANTNTRQSRWTKSARGNAPGHSAATNGEEPCSGERDAQQTADDAEHAAFGEALTRQPSPARAKRRSHGELPLPRHRASEQKARDVRARDEQHDTDGAEQQPQRRADVPTDG